MNSKAKERNKIIDLSDYKIQKVAEQLDVYYGTEKGIEIEQEYRRLLREKKRKEKKRNGNE